MVKSGQTRLSQLVTMGLLVIACWIPIVLPLPGAGFFGLISIFVSVYLAFHWKKLFVAIPVLANPLVLSLGIGAAAWFTAKPTFWRMGLPGYEFFNLDPDTRCYRSTGGCVVTGNEWMFETPHNAGLSLMVMALGKPKHTYSGAYPTMTEATALTKSAPETPLQILNEGAVIVDGKRIIIGKDNAQKMATDVGFLLDTESDQSYVHVQSTIFHGECLVILIRSNAFANAPLAECDQIFLFDLAASKPFARYVVSGHANRISRLLTEL